jgi:hypothetical protein
MRNSANKVTDIHYISGKEIFKKDYYVYDKKGKRLRKWFEHRQSNGYYHSSDKGSYHWPPVLDQIERIWNLFKKTKAKTEAISKERSILLQKIATGKHGHNGGDKVWYAHAFETCEKLSTIEDTYSVGQEEWTLFEISKSTRYYDKFNPDEEVYCFSSNSVEEPIDPINVKLGNELTRLNNVSDRGWKYYHYARNLLNDAFINYIEKNMKKVNSSYEDKAYVISLKGEKFIYAYNGDNSRSENRNRGLMKVSWPTDGYEEAVIE